MRICYFRRLRWFILLVLALLPVLAKATAYEMVEAQSHLRFSGLQEGREFVGQFRRFTVDINLEKGNQAGRIDADIITASADTNDSERDSTLHGSKWFDTGVWPEAEFRSTGISWLGESRLLVSAELTILGVTQALEILFTLEAADGQPAGQFSLRGSTKLDRSDFGLGTGTWKSTEIVANEVTVEVDLRLRSEKRRHINRNNKGWEE